MDRELIIRRARSFDEAERFDRDDIARRKGLMVNEQVDPFLARGPLR